MVQLCVDADERDEALVFPGFLDEVACAALDGFDGEVDVAPGSHDDDWQAAIELLNAGEEIEALLAGGGIAGVVEVDEQDVVVDVGESLKEQLGRADAVYADALRREQQLDSLEDVGLIVGDEDPD
jgi:preprotein translocase subunit YajC